MPSRSRPPTPRSAMPQHSQRSQRPITSPPMTLIEEVTVTFSPPRTAGGSAMHHARAAAHNAAVAREAGGQLLDALSGSLELQRILLKAAAGAGKSYVLKQLV